MALLGNRLCKCAIYTGGSLREPHVEMFSTGEPRVEMDDFYWPQRRRCWKTPIEIGYQPPV